MHIDFTPEHHALRKEIREYYRDLFTPELRAAFEAEHDDDEPIERIVGEIERQLRKIYIVKSVEFQNAVSRSGE